MESKIAGQLIRSPADYAELLEEYHRSDYADGIVVVPLTERRVSAAVAATGRSGDKSIGSFDGREQVSIRALAEVAVLAGCRPDYMPLLVAAMEIMLADNFPASLLLESKGGYFPYVIVNGPIRQAIDLNCRPNLFGPGFRANATIGRALHLALMRFGGAQPQRSTLGNAFKFTCVIGEDEENSPWTPLSTEFGFQPGESTVTLMIGIQTKVLSHQLSVQPEHLLSCYAEEVSTVTQFDPFDVAAEGHHRKAVFILGDDHRGYMTKAGWGRRRMQEYLHEAARRPAGDIEAAGYHGDPRIAGKSVSDPVAIYCGPEDFLIVAAGSGGGRAMAGSVAFVATRKIDEPSAFHAIDARLAAPETVDDYASVVERLVDQKLTDGWPVVPPDAEGVGRFVAAAGRAGDSVLGTAPWRAGPLTVQDLAINALMAGCTVEHMPLLCAIYEILFEPENEGMGGMAASTMGYNAWVVIHGPIGRKLGLNHAGGLLGPGDRGNVAIGRAIRLGMMNLAGLKTDLVDRACLGQAFKYGVVIAEDELASPWRPLHTTFGLEAEESGITVSWGAHPRITYNSQATSPEPLLRSVAEDMSVITNFDSPTARLPGENLDSAVGPGVLKGIRGRLLVMGEGHRRVIEAAGWTREQTQSFLFQRCHRKVSDVRAKGFATTPCIRPDDGNEVRSPLVDSPRGFHILFAGGAGDVSISVSSQVTTRSFDRPAWRGNLVAENGEQE